MLSKFPINTEVVGLRDVLNGRYRIPVYQRPYEWEEKNIDDFLSSIIDGFRDKYESKQECKPVFFGTIQLNHENKNDEVEDIVDGQQRLTTFVLFIEMLQNLCAGHIETYIDCNSIIESDELKKALCLCEEVNNMFEETSRYFINKELLYRKITTDYCQEFNQGPEFYLDLKDYILDNVYFVKLSTEEMELSDVVSVFNTINTTGLDLNASDVFKFRYYDYLKRQDGTTSWMEKINECYNYIDKSNEERIANGRNDQSVFNMSWILDVYKHIICAQFGWGFSEVSKSNQKFFDDLFKGKKYEGQEDTRVLDFDSFENIVKGFIKFWRWIEDERYYDKHNDIAQELFSECLIEKTRYSRYWTIPFVVAFFKADGQDWRNYYEDSLRVNLYMARFFIIYSVINDKVINAVQNKVCGDCFNWFRECSTNEIIMNIRNMMWSTIRWEGDKPEDEFYNIIKSGLFYNGSRVHLVCTLAAFLDEIDNLGNKIKCPSGDFEVSECTIQERLFNWGKNPYDIEHILARNIFKDDKDNIDLFNGIGNLVVLDRNINRNIKDNPVKKKIVEYEKSKYVSVRIGLVEKYERCQDWGVETVTRRQQEEIEKIKRFMNA